MTTARVLPP
uniref:Uncharacterized protein n=1 Tax=Arundo donax TaxID=35708 RepID=A0A0A8ZS19_ARUDO